MTNDRADDLPLDGDLTLSLVLDVPEDRAGAAQDLVSKFDPSTRTGFRLRACASSGGYNGPGDELRISFGIDAGTEPDWVDCGRPSATSNHVTALTVYDGMLYTGNNDAASEADFGHVFRYLGGQGWEDLGQVSPSGDRGVGPLVVHRGALYAATWNHDWTRVGYLSHAPCHVFRFEGPGRWVDCGQPGDSKRIFAMGTYAGDLYAVGDDETVQVYRGGDAWELVEKLPSFAHPITVLGGRMILGTWEHPPTVLAFDGATFDDYGNSLGGRAWCSQVHSLLVHDGALHVGSWPLGKVSRRDAATGQWQDLGRMGDSTEVNGLSEYNGMLYAGALPRAEVFRFDGVDRWTSIRRFHAPPGWGPVTVEDMERPPSGDLLMRDWARVTSLTEHDGRLFATVTSCTGSVIDAPPDVRGSVHAMRAGLVATTLDSLTPGTHRVVAIREGPRSSVLVDGRVAASATRPGIGSIRTAAPLKIADAESRSGLRVWDVHVYPRALGLDEVAGMTTTPAA